MVASIVNPDLAQLIRIAAQLPRNATICMDTFQLKDFADALVKRGYRVQRLVGTDAQRSAAVAYAKIIRKDVSHPNDEILRMQLPHVRTRNVGTGYKLIKEPGIEIDAVYATVEAIYVAENQEPREIPIT
jgi:phage terminase large subunit-like protein